MATNNRIAGERARSIKERLVRKFVPESIRQIRTRSIGEDWALLKRLIRHNMICPTGEQITAMIDQKQESRRDGAADPPAVSQRLRLYERSPLSPTASRRLPHNLRRVDMVKDTVVLTVLDTTYMRGVQQLRDRDYVGALRTPERLQEPEPCHSPALPGL